MMLGEIWLILRCIFSPSESGRFMHDDHEGRRLRCGFSLKTAFIDTHQYKLCRGLIIPSGDENTCGPDRWKLHAARFGLWASWVSCSLIRRDHHSLMFRSFNPSKSPAGGARRGRLPPTPCSCPPFLMDPSSSQLPLRSLWLLHRA